MKKIEEELKSWRVKGTKNLSYTLPRFEKIVEGLKWGFRRTQKIITFG